MAGPAGFDDLVRQASAECQYAVSIGSYPSLPDCHRQRARELLIEAQRPTDYVKASNPEALRRFIHDTSLQASAHLHALRVP